MPIIEWRVERSLLLVLALIGLFSFSPPSYALDPGDVMVVGYETRTPDNVAFVNWVEIAEGASLLLVDADFTASGDGSGEGSGGGRYSSLQTLTWTNNTGSPVEPGTVVVIEDVDDVPSVNTGTVSGGFGLTKNGEQFFIASGTFTDDGTGNSQFYFEGDLIFGVDYEGGIGWGESGESDLPGALDLPLGNLTFGFVDAGAYQGPVFGNSVAALQAAVMDPANWQTFAEGTPLPEPDFLIGGEIDTPDQFGEVSTGLLFHAKRMNGGQPIIDKSWMTSAGATSDQSRNINGPSCIRIPDWVATEDRADPTAQYYLYFAHHQGEFIRMAWAASIEGPWTAFKLSNTLPLQDRGVLSLGTDDIIPLDNNLKIDRHIASPEVLADDANQRFIMYFHGPSEYNNSNIGQKTFVATSSDGLNFNLPSEGGQTGHGPVSVVLGNSYFRLFEQDAELYAFSNTGGIWKAPSLANPWTAPGGFDFRSALWSNGPNPLRGQRLARGWPELRPRHFAVLQRENIVYSFLTYKVGRPERVVAATFDFDKQPTDFAAWDPTFPQQEILRAEKDWEGALFPPLASDSGSKDDGVNQLRDPAILDDEDGKIYMFYSGQGEDAIGLARLVTSPQVNGTAEFTRDQGATFTISHEADVTLTHLKIAHSSAVEVDHDAEAGTNPFTYTGSGSYTINQTQTVGAGSRAFQLAHVSSGDSEALEFPDKYYARPGAVLSYQSWLRSATSGQVAAVQVSFDDGGTWQTLKIQTGGGTPASGFEWVSLDLDGLVGRCFHLRFLYDHDIHRNTSFTSGSGSSQGWFIDSVAAFGLESVQELAEQSQTGATFTYSDFSSVIASYFDDGSGAGDRFLLSVNGDCNGETIPYGKPFVIRIDTAFEEFQDQHFTESELQDDQISGKMADPDGDGIDNKHEHLFGTHPRQPNGSVESLTLDTIDNEVHPGIEFPWNPDAFYTYELQMTTNLNSNFSTVNAFESVFPNGNLETVRLESMSSIDELGSKAFFRLRFQPK